MKKILSLLISAMLTLAVCACSSQLAPDAESTPYDYDNSASAVVFTQSDEISMETEFPVYDKSIDKINILITNNGSDELSYGEKYTLYMQQGDEWIDIYPGSDDSVAWIEISRLLPAGGTNLEVLRVNQLREGVYRYVKQVGSISCYAEFEIGDSPVTAGSPSGYAPLEELGRDYSAEDAEKNGDVVLGIGEIKNSDRLTHFLSMASLGAQTKVRLSSFTVEGDPIIYDIEFSGLYYRVTADSTRDGFGVQAVLSESFSYIITNGSALYLSNCADYDLVREMLYGSERNTMLLTASVDSSWVDVIEKMTQKRSEESAALMRVWNDSGSMCVSINSSGECTVSSGGIETSVYLSSGVSGDYRPVGAAWLDGDSFIIAAQTGSDNALPYIFFTCRSENGTFAPVESVSGSGYTILGGALSVDTSLPDTESEIDNGGN